MPNKPSTRVQDVEVRLNRLEWLSPHYLLNRGRSPQAGESNVPCQPRLYNVSKSARHAAQRGVQIQNLRVGADQRNGVVQVQQIHVAAAEALQAGLNRRPHRLNWSFQFITAQAH